MNYIREIEFADGTVFTNRLPRDLEAVDFAAYRRGEHAVWPMTAFLDGKEFLVEMPKRGQWKVTKI